MFATRSQDNAFKTSSSLTSDAAPFSSPADGLGQKPNLRLAALGRSSAPLRQGKAEKKSPVSVNWLWQDLPQTRTLSTRTTVATAPTSSIQLTTRKFAPGMSEATIAATGAARIQIGTQRIYIGTQQVTSINQNPIIASFDNTNAANRWVRTDYELTGADGRGYGLFWSGSSLYGIFSVDGTQGLPSQDFRRVSSAATQSWLRSYGMGGGPKAAVIARLNPATGAMTEAAYLTAVNSGKTNSLEITGISRNSVGNLVLSANSWFAPRRPDGTPMRQTTTAGSPHRQTIEISPNVRTVVRTSAVGWV